jgi:hypothetical protein
MKWDNNIDEGHADGEEPLHFYYNRTERLKNAPESVRDYYNGKRTGQPHGLFKSLVATKGNRMLLVTVVLCTFLVIFMSLLGNKADRKEIDGVTVQLSAFTFDDSIYVSLHLNANKKYKPDTVKKVIVTVCGIDSDKQKTEGLVLQGNYNGNEQYLRTKFTDYDIIKIMAEVEIAGQKQVLFAFAQHH